jgi:sugar phosphate isomerase/epimerase
MKLGIIGGYDRNSFKYAKSKGLSALEFCINVGTDVNEISNCTDDIIRNIKETGVSVASIGRWGVDRIDGNGKIIGNEQESEIKLIDVCSKIGCPVYVSGCNYIDALSFYDNCTAAIKYLEKLISYGKDKGVKIATYNCRWNSFIHSDPAWTVIHGSLKELGIKYDPSHCISYGGNYLSEMKKWGDRFYHVHIKGSLMIDGVDFDNPPAGMDQTNWGAFMDVLYVKKYDGVLSLEPHSAAWSGELGEKGIDFTIEYFNKFLFK